MFLWFETDGYENVLINIASQFGKQDYNIFSIKALTQLRERFCATKTLRRLEEHFSPFALFYVDFGPLFTRVFGVVRLLFIIRVQIFGDFPEFLRAQLERTVLLRLVPEDLLVQFVGFRIVIDHQALKILSALVHHLTKALKRGEHARVILPDAFAIGDVGLAQDKHVINVRAQIGRNTKRILHCDD